LLCGGGGPQAFPFDRYLIENYKGLILGSLTINRVCWAVYAGIYSLYTGIAYIDRDRRTKMMSPWCVS
jgi:hypothetical protein